MMCSRALCGTVILIAVAVLNSGCTKLIPGGNPTPPADYELRSLLADAASASSSELSKAVERGLDGAALLEGSPNQPLTLVALAADPRGRVCLGDYLYREGPPPDFEWVPGYFDAERVSRCISAPPSKRDEYDADRKRLSGEAFTEKWPTVSILWEEYINDLYFSVDGESISGTVDFEAEGAFHGTVMFDGRHTREGWGIYQFRLPVSGWNTVKGADGRWEASQLFSEDQPARLADIDLKIDGRSVFGDLSTWPAEPAADGVVSLRADSERRIYVSHPGEGWRRVDDVSAQVGGKPITLVLDHGMSVEDVLAVMETLTMTEPPVLAIGIPTSLDIETAWTASKDSGPTSLLTAGRPVRRPVEKPGGVVCIDDRGITRVSTGEEMALPISSNEELVTFGLTQMTRHQNGVFLLNLTGNTKFEDIDAALSALVQSKAKAVFLQVDRFRAIPIFLRESVAFEHRRAQTVQPTIVERRSGTASGQQARMVDRRLDAAVGIPEKPPETVPAGPVRFTVGGEVTEPRKISGPNPVYPEAARRGRIQGVVVLEATIGKDGQVDNLKILRGLPLGLSEAAIDAVKQWIFEPSTLNGSPVEVLYILTVRFNLE